VIGYAFLLPLVLVLLGLMAYPVGRAFWMSLTDKRPGEAAQFIGLQNYRELLIEDSTFPKVVLNSFIYTGSVIGGRFVLGMIMALVLNARFKLREFFRGWLLLPWIMPVVASSLTWTWILNSRGALNRILMGLHIIKRPIAWLAHPSAALISIIIAGVWAGFPFFGMSLLAGMQAISEDLYDAAKVDGASAVQRFWYVTLPGLRSVIIVVTVLSFIWIFNGFTRIWLITGGGPGNASDIIITYAYKQGLSRLRLGYGAAISLVFAPLLFLGAAFLSRYLVGEEGE
jgi:ABC-type sugar transport system permease subunit